MPPLTQALNYQNAYGTLVLAKTLLLEMAAAGAPQLRLEHVAWPEVVETARLLASTDSEDILARLSIGFSHRYAGQIAAN